MDLGLKDKVVIVTGGARGIGAAIVSGFVEEGANVTIGDIRVELAEDLAAKMKGRVRKIVVVRTDVTKKSDAKELVARTMKEFGKVDILVNNAGVVQEKLFVDIEEGDWDRINRINAKGVYIVTQAVVPHMITARYGKIVNISSRSGKDGQIGLSHYAASKFAVIGLTQALAKELGEYNINVNAVCPGIIPTAMWDKILAVRAERHGLPREQIFDNLLRQVPLRRPQNPDDIAKVVLFLSSEVSRNITGEAINVNGGLRMD
jgi:meso-butanediol dehydrogenase/(S,S)-butanediol dehydrogenase/diacetyl reductase